MNPPPAPAAATARAPDPGIPRPDTPGPAGADVELWSAALDEPPDHELTALARLLAPEEAGRAAQFRFARDRRRYVVGRARLRQLLGHLLGRPPEALAFAYGPAGKPRLATSGGAPSALFFNLAHSDGLALYAVSRAGEVGVDLERIRDLPEWEQIAGMVFPPATLNRLRHGAGARRAGDFFLAWTRREALLKALGTGLAGRGPPADEAEWQVLAVSCAPGFAAALACGANVRPSLAVRRWPSDPASGPASRVGSSPPRAPGAAALDWEP